MRFILLVIVGAFAWSCREVTPFEPSYTPASGYVLSGTVTTANGIPLDSVDVILWYTFGIANTPPVDTASVIVTDSTRIVDIGVYNSREEFVRQIFLGYRSTGPIRRVSWDGTDQNSNPVPTGKYIVRYSFDTTIMKNEIRIVHGRSTAMTNSLGRFTLGNDVLPVSQVFDLYDSQGNYSGPRRILPDIELRFRRGSLSGLYSVTLRKDTLNTGSFIVQ